MNRTTITLLLLLLACPAAGELAAADSAGKPNVLIVLVDDAGYGDYACNGNPVVKTPNVDKLCREGIRFADFHVAPMCTPTRSQLITGVDCMRNGASVVCTSRMLLRRDLPTAGDIFAANGYRTGHFGKWHMGENYPFRPQDRGFQDTVYFSSAFIGESDDYWGNDYFDPWLHHTNGKPTQFHGYSNDILFTEAMRWMGERAKKREPFFCYLPLNLVHTPLLVPQKYREPYLDQGPNLASGLGMLANVDENMGHLDDFLRQTGLRDNTILMFLNDNGGTFGVKLWNAGMRGKKMDLYEGGHRSPLFVRWPAGRLRPPGEVLGVTEVQDLLPTVVDLCGLKDTRGAKFDGASLAPVLRGATQQAPDRTLVVEYGSPRQGLTAVMWRRWRLVKNSELYDLATDPGQQKNLITQRPGIIRKLRADYERWWKEIEPWTARRSAIVLGDDHENPATLAPDEHYDTSKLQPKDVRLATYPFDKWLVEIARNGDYEIGLRRWPEEAHATICGSVPEWHSQDSGSSYGLPVGKALPIAKARLSIGGFSGEKLVHADDSVILFTAALKRGRTMLQASFLDQQGKALCDAYYVTVRRK